MEAQLSTNQKFDVGRMVAIRESIALFGALTEPQLIQISKYLEKLDVPGGQIIFHQGDMPSNIYIILSGKIGMLFEGSSDSLQGYEFQTGDCFGETSVIGIQPHSATTIAAEDSELLLLSREALMEIFTKDTELFGVLMMNIAREVSRRLHNSNNLLVSYAKQNGDSNLNEAHNKVTSTLH